jgi:hypothetical protein
VDDRSVLAGDGIAYRAEGDRRARRDRRLLRLKLDYLEHIYRHALMDDVERMELHDRIARLRRALVGEEACR